MSSKWELREITGNMTKIFLKKGRGGGGIHFLSFVTIGIR